MRPHEPARLDPVARAAAPSTSGRFTIHMYGLTLLAAIAICIWITGTRFVNRGGDWDLDLPLRRLGRRRGDRRARGCTTSPRAGTRCPTSGGGRSRSGRAGSASGAGSRSAASSGASSRSGPAPTSWLLADCLAPGLLVAQAVGRIGNWWNQELFGKPTDLPWGLEIDTVHGRSPPSITQVTYHPAFLYEMLWNLFAAALLVYVIERRFHPRPPGLFALYIALYSFGRFWIELVRSIPRTTSWACASNTWVSGLVVRRRPRLVLALPARGGRGPAAAARRRRRPRRPEDGRAEEPRPTRRLGSRRGQRRPRPRAGPRRVRGAVRPPPDALLKDAIQPSEIDMAGIVVAFVERPGRARRARSRRLRRVPRPDRGVARAQGSAPLPRRGGGARRARAGGGGRGARAGGSPSTAA